MKKIRIPLTHQLMMLFPAAALLAKKLPRKKKKALKKRLEREIIKWLENTLKNEHI